MTQATTPSPDQGRPDIRARDPIAALFLNYFAASITIREHVEHLWKCHDAIKNAHERAIFAQSRLGPYFGVWQASLYPVITGFKKLGLRDERVETLIHHLNYIRATAKVVHTYHDHATYIDQCKQLSRRQQQGEVPNLHTVTILHDELEEFFNKYMFAQGYASGADIQEYASGADIQESDSAPKH